MYIHTPYHAMSYTYYILTMLYAYAIHIMYSTDDRCQIIDGTK